MAAPATPALAPPQQEALRAIGGLFLIFFALIVVGIIYFVFIYESPVDKCGKLCAGANAPSAVLNECKLACFQLKYYGGDQALQEQIYEYEHPTPKGTQVIDGRVYIDGQPK